MSNGQHLIVLSGPAGSGKDTFVRELIEKHPEIEVSVSVTTRDKRPGEREGVNYYYISTEEFERRIAAGEVLEYTHYCGNYYGTPKSEVDRRIASGIDVVLIIEVEGAANIKRLYPDAKLVFVRPPSFEELEKRLRGRRTESEEKIRERLARALEEMEYACDYDYVIINDKVEHCAEELYQIVRGAAQF